jgi:hypothetical protein
MAKHNDEVVAGSAKVPALLDASSTDDPITVQEVERLARKRLPNEVRLCTIIMLAEPRINAH